MARGRKAAAPAQKVTWPTGSWEPVTLDEDGRWSLSLERVVGAKVRCKKVSIEGTVVAVDRAAVLTVQLIGRGSDGEPLVRSVLASEVTEVRYGG